LVVLSKSIPSALSALSNDGLDVEILTDTVPLNVPTKLNTSKPIPTWMTDAQKHFKLVFGSLKQKPIIQMWLGYEVLLMTHRKINLQKNCALNMSMIGCKDIAFGIKCHP
jgi:hypothetical protein